MDCRYQPYLIIFIILLIPFDVFSQQQNGYELSFRPDIWYNDVDGIRIGSFFEGRMSGTAEEGHNRIDGGIWLSTWFPALPVSYSLTYTKPVSAYSEYGSELNIQIHSKVREGYHTHGIAVNKRWQQNQNYMSFWEAGVDYYLEKRFDHEYSLFPFLWSGNWKGLIKPNLVHQHINRAGLFSFDLHSRLNTIETVFYTASISISQQIRIGGSWELRIRGFAETISDGAYGEYQLFKSSGSEIGSLDSRVSQSKGTVPVKWANRGFVHFSGGPNLRGYRKSDVHSIIAGNPNIYERVGALNIEFDFPNPVQHTIRNMEQISKFISFRSYLFTDMAAAYGHSDPDTDGLFSNLGAGLALTLNIPDYLGKPRGFVIRYESPFWLSEPQENEKFQWRHILGFGATIAF